MTKKVIVRWQQHRTSVLVLLAIAGAQAPSLLIGRTQPGQSVDCDSGWIGQTINRARQELSPQSSDIPEGERNQIAEVYKVPASQIQLSEPQAIAPRTVAPSGLSFKPSTPMPPGRVPLTESNAATPDELAAVKRQPKGLYVPSENSTQEAMAQAPAQPPTGDATEARMRLTALGYSASDVINMDDAAAISAANQGKRL